MILMLLLKFGLKEHLEMLLKDGMVYFNQLSSFKKDDENSERFDELEGALKNIPILDSFIEIREQSSLEWKKLSIEKGRITHFADISEINSCSFFAICREDFEKETVLEFAGSLKKFGTHFLIIRNPVDFLKRVDKEIHQNGYQIEQGLVEYLDFKLPHENLTLFNKSNQICSSA